ncbi:MAG: hypothetical protein ABSG78_21955 [Verrucomicrobiota bacterium]|jgi:hypothetical protein
MRFIRFALWPALMACLLAGCASGPKTDWNGRVGKYTYDQAAQELGAPDKSAKEGDGTMVAEWLVRSYSPATVEQGGGDYMATPGWVAPEVMAVYPGGPDSGKWLRLVFAPDGTLRSWKRFQR